MSSPKGDTSVRVAGASQERSFAEAIRGTSIIGGATAANLAVSALRAKAFAVLLGPEGTGVIALLTTVTGFVGTICGFGMGTVGVREMSQRTAQGDPDQTKRTARTVLRAALLTGVLGVLIQSSLSGPLSQIAFGDKSMSAAIVTVSLVLLFQGVTTGRQAYLQGTRQLAKFALQSVLNAAAGTAVSVAVVIVGGRSGIPSALLAGAIAAALVSYLFGRIPRLREVQLPWSEFVTRAASMYRLGAFLSAGGAVTMGANVAISAILNAHFGTGGVGLYSAAWGLSGMYVGFVLAALGSDYLPRLVRVIGDTQTLTTVVNEQISVALLLGIPGILATLLLAQQILHFFFTADFAAATDPLRWIVAGLLARLMSWPLGYILIAANRGAWFFLLEVLANLVQVGLVLALVEPMGLPGAGLAFAISAVVYLGIVVSLSFMKFGVRLRRGIVLHGGAGFAGAAFVMILAASEKPMVAQSIGAVTLGAASALSLRELEKRSGLVSLILARLGRTMSNRNMRR